VKRPYHHGDLQRALLDAALALIEESGAGSLTLRAVARRVGVTHAAPYRHFVDKAALLAAVAAEGFKLLTDRLTAARDASGTAPLDRMAAIGMAYVGFAVEHPAHYRVMFGRDLEGLTEDHPFRASAEAAFGVLTDCVAEFSEGSPQADAPTAPTGDYAGRAIVAWATVHGLALLMADRRLPCPSEPAARDALVAGLLRQCRLGLGDPA